MIAVIVAKKVLNPQMGVPVCNDCMLNVRTAAKCSFAVADLGLLI